MMDKNISYGIFAPKLDDLIYQAKNEIHAIDDHTTELVFELFQKLQAVAACGEDERRELWLTVERGTIDDFGDYDEYIEYGEVESREEFENLWLYYYPDSLKWYKLITLVHNDGKYRTIILDGNQIIEIDERPLSQRLSMEKQNAADYTELVTWILNAVENCIENLRAETYNEFVNKNLPYKKRVGKILGEECWRIYPKWKEEYLKDIANDEIRQFLELIKDQPEISPIGRLSKMTAGSFYDYCRLGYEANNYEGINEMTPKELYYRHADGRDDGLKDVPEDSADAFMAWFNDKKRFGGHPWEVCRGGNSTHISLYAVSDEQGWWLALAGSSHGRSIETVKFYLALAMHNIPVYLYDGREIAAMLTGKDWIGIVPEGVFPRYCDALFPGEGKMIQYMNLPFEETNAFIEATVWYPEDEVFLV